MSTATHTVRIPVSGMTCAACQSRVQRTLQKQVGVNDAAVNLLLHDAMVTYDANTTTPQTLVDAIRDVGYGAELPVSDQSVVDGAEARDAADLAEFRTLRLKAIVSAVVGAFVMFVAMPLMVPAWVQMLLALIIMTWAGRHFYVRAWAALRHGASDMNTLIALGTGSAFAYSVIATLSPERFATHGVMPDVYYEAVIVIIAFVLTGNAFEARAKTRTTSALRALTKLQPKIARIVRDGVELDVPLAHVSRGDIVSVRPGERIPVDGLVTDGESTVDEAMMTGEAMPVHKQIGAAVIGGTINGTGAFRMQVTTVGASSVLSQIVSLMRDAQSTRAPIQALADRVSAVFVPIVLVLSAVTFALWMLIPEHAAWMRALAASVAVMIIACPCAMGLAVPTAVMVATGKAAQLGILMKGGDVLQRAGNIQTVVLDKTGTLTEGRPSVSEIMTAGGDASTHEMLRAAASLESVSEHPLAEAIVRHAREHNVAIVTPTHFESRTGLGVLGDVDARQVVVGSAALLSAHSVTVDTLAEQVARVTNEGQSVLFVAIDGALQGAIAVSDPIKVSASRAVAALRAMGIDVVMLTGDNERTANAIARTAGISRVVADVLPAGKVAAIRQLQREQNGRIVAMVGDGVNDAPALAQADVGMAIGTGTDVARQAADVVLMRGDLQSIVHAISLSRATMRTMKQNLFWAFVYNVIGIPIAAGALYPSFGVMLSPMLASAAMAFSSVSVVTNSLRLRRVALV